MLNPISNPINLPYLTAQKSTDFDFLTLALEIREEIESQLDFSSRLAFFNALTTVTRNRENRDHPTMAQSGY